MDKMQGRFLRIAACGICLAGGALLLPARAGKPIPASDTPVYSSEFSQIASGASSGGSAHYGVEDVIRVAACNASSEASDHYAVVNTLSNISFANNGLALGQGTIMTVQWNAEGRPAGSRGFEVSRSSTGVPGSFAVVTPVPLPEPPLVERDLPNGNYYYIVYLIAADNQRIQWTPVIRGSIDKTTDASVWARFR